MITKKQIVIGVGIAALLYFIKGRSVGLSGGNNALFGITAQGETNRAINSSSPDFSFPDFLNLDKQSGGIKSNNDVGVFQNALNRPIRFIGPAEAPLIGNKDFENKRSVAPFLDKLFGRVSTPGIPQSPSNGVPKINLPQLPNWIWNGLPSS